MDIKDNFKTRSTYSLDINTYRNIWSFNLPSWHETECPLQVTLSNSEGIKSSSATPKTKHNREPFQYKYRFATYDVPKLKIKWLWDSLIFH